MLKPRHATAAICAMLSLVTWSGITGAQQRSAVAAQPERTRMPVVPAAAEQGATVRSRRAPREMLRHTIERDEAERIPGSFGDALRAIQNLPGMARAPFFSGALVVRGSAPSDSVAFVDGTPIPLLYHFGGLSSTVQTSMLERIDFYPANFSAQYGRAGGGIVDVGLRSPRRVGTHGIVTLGVLDASAFVEGALSRTVSVAVAGRYGWLGGLLTALNIQGPDGTGYKLTYGDYQGVLEWRPDASNRVRLAIFGDVDVIETRVPGVSGEAPASRRIAVQYHIAQLSLVHEFRPGTQAKFMLSVGLTRAEWIQTNAVHLDSVPITFRYELSHVVSPTARVRAGIDLLMGPAMGRIPALGSGPYRGRLGGYHDARAFVYQPALYAELELMPVRGLRVFPGVRFDYARSNQQAVIAPRLAARWQIAPAWVVRGGIGLFTQPPRFNENSLLPVEALDAQNPIVQRLDTARVMHYGLGVEHNFTSAISLSVEGFVKTSDAVLVGVVPPDLLLSEEDPPLIPVSTTGAGRAYGIEVLLRHRLTDRLFGWLAYTLMRSERREAPGRPWHLADYDQTHNLTVVASYRLGYGVEVGLRFRYVTGRATTPYVGSVYDANSLRYISVRGATNSARLPDFHQLDLRVEKRWVRRWGSIGAYLELINTYNQPNTEGYYYSDDGSQRVALPGLPIVPNIGLRGEL